MFDNSIVKKTGQMWKLKLAFLLLLIGGASLFYGLRIMTTKPDALVASLIFGGIVVGIASLIFGCLSVRCPNCKAPWLWQGISGQSSGNWLIWLMSRAECPKCKS